jgi:hypothetical protein
MRLAKRHVFATTALFQQISDGTVGLPGFGRPADFAGAVA